MVLVLLWSILYGMKWGTRTHNMVNTWITNSSQNIAVLPQQSDSTSATLPLNKVGLILTLEIVYRQGFGINTASYPGQFALSELPEEAWNRVWIFPASLIEDVTSEIAEDDCERGWDKQLENVYFIRSVWYSTAKRPHNALFRRSSWRQYT